MLLIMDDSAVNRSNSLIRLPARVARDPLLAGKAARGASAAPEPYRRYAQLRGQRDCKTPPVA